MLRGLLITGGLVRLELSSEHKPIIPARLWVVFRVHVYMYGWIDGWILTMDSLPVRGPGPGTPPTGQAGLCATNMHMPDTTRMH